jgi:hypothetical protein
MLKTFNVIAEYAVPHSKDANSQIKVTSKNLSSNRTVIILTLRITNLINTHSWPSTG